MSEEIATAASPPAAEAAPPQTCDRCDRESRHLTRWLDPEGNVEQLCWSCQQRREKRVNLNQRWKRERRG
jgi:hypothetical protein